MFFVFSEKIYLVLITFSLIIFYCLPIWLGRMDGAGGHTVLVDRLRSWEEKDLITWKKVWRESKLESTVIHREEKVWISICALVSNAARILMCLRLCELSWRADRTWLQSINPPPLVLSLSFFHSLTSKIFIQLVSGVTHRANNILANKDLATIDHINQIGSCSCSQGITPYSPT